MPIECSTWEEVKQKAQALEDAKAHRVFKDDPWYQAQSRCQCDNLTEGKPDVIFVLAGYSSKASSAS
jgi:hypothetical protein